MTGLLESVERENDLRYYYHEKRAVIAYASSNGSGDLAHPYSLARTYAVQCSLM